MDGVTVSLYRLAVWFVPLLPERFGYWLFARIGDAAFYLNTNSRKNLDKNLKHALGTNTPSGEYARISRRALENLLKNYFDLFRGHALTEAQVYAQLESVQGLEHLDAALAQGKGIVGGSAHFGNFNLFLHLTAVHLKRQAEIIVPVERLKPEQVFEIAVKQRAAQGIDIVPVDTAGRILIKKLRAGAVLGLAIDLDVTGTGPIVNFFGEPAQLPDGAAVLAVKYKAPLILAFIRRLENNKCAVVVEPPLELESTGDLARDTLNAEAKIVARMEYWIKKYPDQWIMLRPLWEKDKEENDKVTR